ncbi:D-hexose-6-phosphate mutarotase [Motilimonas cestriensis]|uniref:Putative glucose-6-phosphate 1-epimerase n=1 Tax=Motilimonas cestriensis TaxID=2742685 RepID=A0ABS8WF07_9GAMM|nr:D-hexose-6-phosphate mutarotase [Motilimonas cestriensis]MCE2596712.1 D-hexose-6-phosphate mutarotase [Motilimonas cestriensis]
MIDHLKLTTKQPLSPSVQLMTDANQVEFISIAHPNAQACFTLHGAHLIHFQPTGKAPIIWLSKTAVFDNNKAIRGGVPICWPWFGAPAAELGNGLPSHGFARNTQWQLGDISEDESAVTISFKLVDTPATQALWPHSFELTLTATIGDSVQLSLTTKNTGNESLTYLAALHTYLNISAPEKTSVAGLGPTYVDSLDNKCMKNGAEKLSIAGPIDSLYIEPTDKVTLMDSGYDRELAIQSSGHDTIVTWTPWVEGARGMADMPDDGYQTMLCLEAAITGTAVEVAPGQTHILSTSIT